MARGILPLFHHIGTFLLFVSAILLLVTTISAPVVNDISLLKVTLTNFTDIRNSSVTFGTFGYCILDVPPVSTDQDWCSGKSVGYQPAYIMAAIEGTGFSTASSDTADGLTRVMVLHPVACGLAFIAFFLALGSGICGSLLASLLSFVTLLITIVVMACDFVAFGIIRDHVNSDGTGSQAKFGPAIWTILAAMVTLFFATIIVFSSCCWSRRSRRNETRHSKVDPAYAGDATVTRRRRFWQRGSRY